MGRRKKVARSRTRVYVVQDKSGSMGSRRAETISGFNEYVNELRKDAEGEVLLSLVQFDTAVDTPYTSKPLAEVPTMTEADFIPGGMTALRDGVGRAIVDASRQVQPDDKVLVIIMTDGGENSSREYSHEAILDQIKAHREKGWEFVFLGAGEEAWNAGRMLGIADSHVINYGTFDVEDHSQVYAAAAATTSNVTRGVGAAFDVQVKARLEDKAKTEAKDADRFTRRGMKIR